MKKIVIMMLCLSMVSAMTSCSNSNGKEPAHTRVSIGHEDLTSDDDDSYTVIIEEDEDSSEEDSSEDSSEEEEESSKEDSSEEDSSMPEGKLIKAHSLSEYKNPDIYNITKLKNNVSNDVKLNEVTMIKNKEIDWDKNIELLKEDESNKNEVVLTPDDVTIDISKMESYPEFFKETGLGAYYNTASVNVTGYTDTHRFVFNGMGLMLFPNGEFPEDKEKSIEDTRRTTTTFFEVISAEDEREVNGTIYGGYQKLTDDVQIRQDAERGADKYDYITAICSDAGYTGEDYYMEYAGGVKLDMKLDEVEKALGKLTPLPTYLQHRQPKDIYYYKNDKYCMVIEYDYAKHNDWNSDKLVTDIYVFNVI